jgi:DNA polymerase type B, organellar and viral
MHRQQHYLTRPTRCTLPKRVVVLDAVCDPVAELFGGPIVDVRLRHWRLTSFDVRDGQLVNPNAFTGISEVDFWKVLCKEMNGHKLTWVFGFDLLTSLTVLGFWEQLLSFDWILTDTDPLSPKGDGKSDGFEFRGYLVVENPPTIIVAKPSYQKGTAKFVDIRNYGVNKVEVNSENGLRDTGTIKVVSGLLSALRDGKLGGLQSTAPSQSMHSYRRHCMDTPILVHGNGRALLVERDSIFSGRNEAYRLGHIPGPVFHLDYNSHYPATAERLDIPVRLVLCDHISLIETKEAIAKGYSVIADCLIETPVAFAPKRLNGVCCFPIGRFFTTLAGPELAYGIDKKWVTRIGIACVYETDKAFSKWTQTMRRLRTDAEAKGEYDLAAAYKRIANSLFGKFAQWSWKWVDAPEYSANEPFDLWYGPSPETGTATCIPHLPGEQNGNSVPGYHNPVVRWRSIAWNAQYESPRAEHRESCPAISSTVYSAARLVLLEAMQICGPGNVFYCDSDSIWTNSVGISCLERSGLCHPTEWGKLKLVGEYPWMTIRGLKHYETPGIQVHAGIPEDAERIGSWKWGFKSPEPLAKALAQRRVPKVHFVQRKSDYSGIYRHGIVKPGGVVHPFQLYEE